MGVFNRFRSHHDGQIAESVLNKPTTPTADSKDANREVGNDIDSRSGSDTLSIRDRNEKEIQNHPEEVTADAQEGVKKAEAAALVWPMWAVYATYGWIWVCFFMLALQSAIQSNVSYYAYSEFEAAAQISTANILSVIIGGIVKLPFAKLVNIWGRAEGYLVFVGVYLLGLIVLASCNGPDGYAAGYVLYWIGYDQIYLALQIYIADTSGLKNRAWAFAFASTPFIATAFVGPLAAASFINTSGWRWAFGSFTIIMTAVFVPIAIVFKYFEKKAQKQGLYVKQSSGRTKMESIVHYIHEFGIIGMFILMAAFVIFLLPFSLVSYGRLPGYKSGGFIAMVIIGFLLFPAFYVWERYFARVHYVRWELIKNPTVFGACILSAVAFFSFYAWDQYYYYFVIVVYNLSVSKAGYMAQIYNVGSTFFGVAYGIYIRWAKHFKYSCLFFGLPLLMLGSGLMIYFRGSDQNIGYIIMCQIFISCAGGVLVIGEDMAVMASSDHDGVPMLLAILGLSSNLGGAIGQAVAASIYGGTFVSSLTEALPEASKSLAASISAGGYLTQITYPEGGDIRNAIVHAWGQEQKWNCVASTAVLALGIPAIAIWKNYNVEKKQNKGNIIDI